MKTPFDMLDRVVADKKYNFYKIEKEETFRDAEPGEHMPVGYTKIPTVFQLKECYLGHNDVLEAAYYKTQNNDPNSLYDIDADFVKAYLGANAKHLMFLRDGAVANQPGHDKRPIVGTYMLDTYNNYCQITAITKQDPNGGRVRRVSYQKKLNKHGLPFQRKVGEDYDKYFSPYNVLNKSHLQIQVGHFKRDIRLLNVALTHNDNLDAQLANPIVKDGWVMQETTGSDGTSSLSKDLIRSAVEALQNTTDEDIINKFKVATEAFNKYD